MIVMGTGMKDDDFHVIVKFGKNMMHLKVSTLQSAQARRY